MRPNIPRQKLEAGKPTVNAAAQAPGIGDFTIVIGDHDARGNPINNMPRD